jgi:hypothetical protein
MQNHFEGYCYVCGLVVEEEKGIAEQVHKRFLSPRAPGFGEYRWCVRHVTCPQPTKPFGEQDQSQKTN